MFAAFMSFWLSVFIGDNATGSEELWYNINTIFSVARDKIVDKGSHEYMNVFYRRGKPIISISNRKHHTRIHNYIIE